MAVHKHKKAAPETVSVFVLTVSDTRGPEDDHSGNLIAELLESAGHLVVGREVVLDDVELIKAVLGREVKAQRTEVVLVTGGTGICNRDVTPEAVGFVLDKEMPGFGELFRFLSFDEIGSAAILSRAVAGISSGTVIFAMPGSRAAVRLAMERIIIPELSHVVFEAKK